MIAEVNAVGWNSSQKYQRLSAFEKELLMNFINQAVLSAYRQWIADDKRIPLETVIDLTNRMVLDGVNGFFRS